MASLELEDIPGLLRLEDIASYQEKYETQEGKFIRIGRFVLVGPFSDKNSAHRTMHNELYNRVQRLLGGDLSLLVGESDEPTLVDNHAKDEKDAPTSIHDAGMFQFLSHDLLPQEQQRLLELNGRHLVQVNGYSGSYRQAGPEGRRLTGEVFQATLGESVIVQSSNW